MGVGPTLESPRQNDVVRSVTWAGLDVGTWGPLVDLDEEFKS